MKSAAAEDAALEKVLGEISVDLVLLKGKIVGSTPPAAKADMGEGNGGADTTPGQPAISIEAIEEAATTVEPRLTVQKWSDLGIGIDKDGSDLAWTPCPEHGAVFPREEAVTLDLPGKRWKGLLDLLARSEHGNRAKKPEVMMQFGYLKSGEISTDDLSELVNDGCKMEMLKTAAGHLTGAIADLGRELRGNVGGPNDRGSPAVLSVADATYVQAAFVVRHLVRGLDVKLRFGEEPRRPD